MSRQTSLRPSQGGKFHGPVGSYEEARKKLWEETCRIRKGEMLSVIKNNGEWVEVLSWSDIPDGAEFQFLNKLYYGKAWVNRIKVNSSNYIKDGKVLEYCLSSVLYKARFRIGK